MSFFVIVQNILLFGYKTDVLLYRHKSFIDQSVLYIRVTLAKKFLPREDYEDFKSCAYEIQEFPRILIKSFPSNEDFWSKIFFSVEKIKNLSNGSY